MPKHKIDNLGDLQKYVYLRGIITAIDSSDDTATVAIGDAGHTGCLIYYHCDPEAEKRSNGAIEGGSAGFSEDDEVIVMAKMDKPDTYETLWVIGHTDGIRKCGFQIKLTRDDGTVIGWPGPQQEGEDVEFISLVLESTTGTSKHPTIYVLGSDETHEYWSQNGETGIWSYSPFDEGDEYFGAVVATFNPATNYWTIFKWPWREIAAGEKFWINAQCQYDVPVQHPYRYKPADKLDADDAVQPGKYDVQIPYFRTLSTPIPEMTYEIVAPADGTIHDLLSHLELNKLVKFTTGSAFSWLVENDTHTTRLKVWCSVPWILTETIQEKRITSSGFDSTSNCFGTNCAVTTCEVFAAEGSNDIEVTGPNISYSGDSFISGGMTVTTEYAPVSGSEYDITIVLTEKVSELYPQEAWCEDTGGVWHSIQQGENFQAYIFSDAAPGPSLVNKKLISAAPKLT